MLETKEISILNPDDNKKYKYLLSLLMVISK